MASVKAVHTQVGRAGGVGGTLGGVDPRCPRSHPYRFFNPQPRNPHGKSHIDLRSDGCVDQPQAAPSASNACANGGRSAKTRSTQVPASCMCMCAAKKRAWATCLRGTLKSPPRALVDAIREACPGVIINLTTGVVGKDISWPLELAYAASNPRLRHATREA